MTRPILEIPAIPLKCFRNRFCFPEKVWSKFFDRSSCTGKIIRFSEITKDDFVLEIGPGIGTMDPVSGGSRERSNGG